jgi:hypothetical protein
MKSIILTVDDEPTSQLDLLEDLGIGSDLIQRGIKGLKAVFTKSLESLDSTIYPWLSASS